MDGVPGASFGESSAAPVRRRVVSGIIGFVLKYANRSVGIRGMQKELNAELGRVCVMRVSDTGQEWFFRVWDGRVEVLEPTRNVAGGFEVSSDTLIALALGRRRVRDPGSGREFEVQFGPLEALTHGELRIWGDAVSNDALMFVRLVYKEVSVKMGKQLNEAVGQSVSDSSP